MEMMQTIDRILSLALKEIQVLAKSNVLSCSLKDLPLLVDIPDIEALVNVS